MGRGLWADKDHTQATILYETQSPPNNKTLIMFSIFLCICISFNSLFGIGSCDQNSIQDYINTLQLFALKCYNSVFVCPWSIYLPTYACKQ